MGLIANHTGTFAHEWHGIWSHLRRLKTSPRRWKQVALADCRRIHRGRIKAQGCTAPQSAYEHSFHKLHSCLFPLKPIMQMSDVARESIQRSRNIRGDHRKATNTCLMWSNSKSITEMYRPNQEWLAVKQYQRLCCAQNHYYHIWELGALMGTLDTRNSHSRLLSCWGCRASRHQLKEWHPSKYMKHKWQMSTNMEHGWTI